MVLLPCSSKVRKLNSLGRGWQIAQSLSDRMKKGIYDPPHSAFNWLVFVAWLVYLPGHPEGSRLNFFGQCHEQSGGKWIEWRPNNRTMLKGQRSLCRPGCLFLRKIWQRSYCPISTLWKSDFKKSLRWEFECTLAPCSNVLHCLTVCQYKSVGGSKSITKPQIKPQPYN